MPGRRQPKCVYICLILEHCSEKIGHLVSQVPATDRATINDDESSCKPEPGSHGFALGNVKLEPIEISATWHNFVRHTSIPQTVPLADYRPYTVGQGDDAIRSREGISFHFLGE